MRVAFRGRGAPAERIPPEPAGRGLLGAIGVVAAVVLILVLADPAVPVLAVAIVIVAIRLGQRQIAPRRLQDVDIPSLAGVFLVAVALGTLARVWSFPGQTMATAGSVATSAIGALTSVVVNNLPAAVLLGSRMPAHPHSLLLGLNIGPNLAVTGSLSALIWWTAARSAGSRPSALRYSAVGIVLVPLTLAAALAASHLQ